MVRSASITDRHIFLKLLLESTDLSALLDDIADDLTPEGVAALKSLGNASYYGILGYMAEAKLLRMETVPALACALSRIGMLSGWYDPLFLTTDEMERLRALVMQFIETSSPIVQAG